MDRAAELPCGCLLGDDDNKPETLVLLTCNKHSAGRVQILPEHRKHDFH